MKKSKLILSLAFAFIMLFSINIQAQEFDGLDKSPMDAASFPTSYKDSDKFVKVVYSRPQLKDRAVSKLAPNGKVWRTGANEAAEMTVYKPIKLGGQRIEPGTYSLFTIPGDTEWTIILSSDVNVWGAYSYKATNDVVRFKAPVREGKRSLEAFTIAFSDDAMYLGWGGIRVVTPFSY